MAKMQKRLTLFFLALIVLAGGAAEAFAQRTKFDGLRQCERFGAVQFRRQEPGFRRFMIDRSAATSDRFAERVGSQFVATIYSGMATFDAGSGPKRVHFICLHAGYARGPVFIYTLPD